jgi:hypothetical protein
MTIQKHYYIYSFVDNNGHPIGWNTEVATSAEKAYDQALKRWAGTDLRVDANSFEIRTEEEDVNLWYR